VRIAVVNECDAINLATALIWRDRILRQMVTHDPVLGAAARAFGFDVRAPDTTGSSIVTPRGRIQLRKSSETHHVQVPAGAGTFLLARSTRM